MPNPRLVLVHSPLTGPSFWSGVRDGLWARGRRAYLARLPAPEHVHPPYWLTHAAGVAAGLPDEGQVVLVGHSGAGPLLPAIGRLARNRGCSATITGYVLVDCDLPRDGYSRLDLFDDDAAAAALRGRCTGGWMPQWSSSQLQDLLPDPEQRHCFLAELPRVPLALYQEPITVPHDWPEAPCAYLQLSEHYQSSVRQAERLRWPMRRLPGHHFLPVSDPETVAEALVELVDEIAWRRDDG